MKLKQRFGRVLMASAMLGAGWSAAAQATTLEISITNTAQAGGFAITPVYSAFHDGAFDAFDAGSAASAGVELIAETGMTGGLPGERLAVSPDSVAVVVGAPQSGPPTIDPGETGTATINVDGLFSVSGSFALTQVSADESVFGAGAEALTLVFVHQHNAVF